MRSATTGSKWLISSCPYCTACATQVSLPMTAKPICTIDIGTTGLTLPGMIDEPACTAGSRISPNPPEGPDDSTIRSDAIFANEAAAVRSSAETRENTSRFCIASNALPGAVNGTPVRRARWRNTSGR